MTIIKKYSNIYGKLLVMIGSLIIVPIIVVPFYPDESKYLIWFLLPGVASIIIGLLICVFLKQNKESSNWKHSMQSSSFIVLFAWFTGFILGAIPFVLSGELPVVGALFESVSGWTTTGLSVMNVAITPKIMLFHRSFMQFCGGLGFIMMMVMLIQEKQSMNLYSAEGHPDKLMPNLKKTARIIFAMYMSFLVLGTGLYVVFGMGLFDALNHSMCALSTGGFSTKLGSIGEYQSLPIDIITIFLMIIGTTNFSVLLLVTKRKWKQFLKVSEVRFMSFLILFSTILIAISLIFQANMGVVEGFSRAMFDGVSALSTTGYSSMIYNEWPQFALGILIILMLIGGGIGSTAGGLKMTRVYLLLRMTVENIKKRISPSRRVTISKYYRSQGLTEISPEVYADTIGFVVSYITIFVIGSFLVTLTANSSLIEGMFEFASALGTVGLSIGITTTTTSNTTLIIEMIGMIVGRLEIFIVLVGLYSGSSIIKNSFIKLFKKTYSSLSNNNS